MSLLKKPRTGIRILYKTTLMLSLIGGFIGLSFIARGIIRDPAKRRRFHSKAVTISSRISLKILNVKVKKTEIESLESSQFIVSNHMGVLDILIIAAQQPTLFITSVDMRETPGLGLITEMAGCLYVERRSRLNIHNEIQNIRNTLTEGHNITLYPEGMATSGDKVYPFKKSLLTAAAGTGVPIKPVVVNFKKVNDEDISSRWRDFVCWYGDQSFLPAMMRTFSTASIEAEIHYLEKVIMESDEDRRAVAETLHGRISEKFHPIK
jgi:1-acyl-sn-glycerol-3-phosphate acyltransferase